MEPRHAGAKLGDFADILMTDDHGRFDMLRGPFVPVIDMNVGAANRGFVYFDQHLAGTRSGDGYLTKLQTGSGSRLYDSVHHTRHNVLQLNTDYAILLIQHRHFMARPCCCQADLRGNRQHANDFSAGNRKKEARPPRIFGAGCAFFNTVRGAAVIPAQMRRYRAGNRCPFPRSAFRGCRAR